MPNDSEYLASANLTEDAAPVEAAPQPEVESFEYYMGDQANKIPQAAELRLTHNGQLEKLPLKTLVNNYRQGAHYESKFKELNQTRAEFEKQKAEHDKYKGFYDKYGQFQDWSEQNPDEWNRIYELYQNKDKYLQGQEYNPLMNEVNTLKQQLQGFNEFKSNFEKQQEEQQAQKDVDEVKTEISTFQKDFPEINLEEADPDGVKLWAKVVQFGLQNGLPDFETAALKYLKPRLLDTVSARARNEAVKGIQSAKQKGEVARSPTPFNLGQGDRKIDFKNTSYNELLEIARGSLGQAQG